MIDTNKLSKGEIVLVAGLFMTFVCLGIYIITLL